MATQADIERYRSVLTQLSTVAFAQLKQLLAALDDPNPERFRNALMRAYPELLRPYLSASYDVSAQWYTELRRAAAVPGRPSIPTFASPAAEQLEAIVGYAVSPLFSERSGGSVLSHLAGSTQRLIASQGRDVISSAVASDPSPAGWARVPSPGCCAFCAMLASRGASYNSREAALRVVGRGVDASVTAGRRGGQGRGQRPRGEQKLGDKYHDFCRCVATPVFDAAGAQALAEAQAPFAELYEPRVDPDSQYGALSVSATLAAMRKEHGLK